MELKNCLIFILIIIIIFLSLKTEHYNKEIIKLLQQHFVYTTLITTTIFDNEKNLKILQKKLGNNQKNIGYIFTKKFNKNVGTIITSKLMKYINIASKILISIKNKDSSDGGISMLNFNKNAYEIGTFLDKLFKTDIYKIHMRNHVTSLINFILSYSHIGFQHKTIKYLDKYLDNSMEMAIDIGKNIG
jgi:hypothetical protein